MELVKFKGQLIRLNEMEMNCLGIRGEVLFHIGLCCVHWNNIALAFLLSPSMATKLTMYTILCKAKKREPCEIYSWEEIHTD